jgi:GTP-binding protein EngB required for normal cell division
MTPDRVDARASPLHEDAVSELPSWLDDAAAIAGIAAAPLAALRGKVREHAFNLVVAGEFKRGKSTVINALLGAEVLPTAVVPLTSVVTLLVHADTPGVSVEFDSGERRGVALDALPDYVTERGNPNNAKAVHAVTVAWPAPWLAGGIRLVDTPGIGSVHQHNTEVTRRYLPEADAVVFVASVDQPLSRNEVDFLADIRRHAGKTFCLLNKIDHLSDAELVESTAFAAQALREALGDEVPVFPLSARLALRARLTDDPDLLARSRLPEFDAALRGFLANESGAVWVRSVRQQLLQLLDEARLSAELELGALAAPLAALDARLAAFAERQAQTLHARRDFDALLDRDGKALVSREVEPSIDAFRERLVARLDASLERWAAELQAQGSAALQAGLEARTLDELRAAFDAFRTELEGRVGPAFEALCARFSERIQKVVEELASFSAGLFDIPYAAGGGAPPWHARARFSYRFWDMPPSLLLMRNTLVRWLPGAIGHPILLRDAKRRAKALVSTQAARLSYDFEERIRADTRDFRREMNERVDATLAGLEAAMRKGRAVRERGEDDARARRAELASVLAAIQALRDRVLQDPWSRAGADRARRGSV